jgi:integrase
MCARRRSIRSVCSKTISRRKAAAQLAAAIAAMDVIGTETFLITDYGKPFRNRGFGSRMREWTDAAGIPPITDVNGKVKNAASHGLRKLCLTRLAEAGCTVVEMQGISGHKDLRELALYVDSANRKKAAAEAMKKLLAAQGADQNRNVVCLTGQDS